MNQDGGDQSLDDFGRKLVRGVRDKTINDFEKLFTGNMKGVYGEYFGNLVSSFSELELEKIHEIATDVVDRTIHNFLWMLEQSSDFTVSATQSDGTFKDLVQLSDGLAGELYSDGGWISRFTDKRKSRMDELMKNRFQD